MRTGPNVLESKATIRFQDCDPFNHLNNAEYLNYLINAREDQLIENYGIDIYEMGRTQGKSWVVGTTQIAYLKPAFVMEKVIIQSQLLRYTESEIWVELRMLDKSKTEIKAVMWSSFVHFNFLSQKREIHSEGFMELFESVLNPTEQSNFQERATALKTQNALA